MNEFQFNCPKCGQNILADGKWSGRRMTCPSCDTRIIIPAAESSAKKGRNRPVAIEAPPKGKIRVKLPPGTGGKSSSSTLPAAKLSRSRPRRAS